MSIKLTLSKENEIAVTPIVKSLNGSFTAPKDFDYNKELSKSLSKKYLNDKVSGK